MDCRHSSLSRSVVNAKSPTRSPFLMIYASIATSP